MHAVFERCEYWRLRDAVGKPAGLLGWWPSRSVTFLENHDTGTWAGWVRGGRVWTQCDHERGWGPAPGWSCDLFFHLPLVFCFLCWLLAAHLVMNSARQAS
jgi:hypothetical protein